MIIEFFGLPATGKTTLSKEISRKFEIPIISVSKRSELIFLNFLFVLNYPWFSIKTLYLICINSYNLQIFYLKFMNCFVQHNAKYMKAKNNGLGIIDEGHIQNIISIYESNKSQKSIEDYIKISPKADMYIFLSIKESERKKRILKRGYEAREGLDDANRAHAWRKVIPFHVDTIKENLNHLPNVFIIESKSAVFNLYDYLHEIRN